jgi:hypothetical protein
MSPDFEYFLRLTPQGRFGHTLPGLVVFTLPLALAVLWLFHRSAKFAVMKLLPTCIQQRLICANDFPFGNARRFALLVLSVLAGALTHIVWDSFTHRQSWLVDHWPLLRQTVVISWITPRPLLVWHVLQHVSTLVGMGILAVWFIVWLHTAAPSQMIDSPLSRGAKLGGVLLLLGLAVCGALLRTAHLRSPSPSSALGVFAVSSIALLWWELVALGWWWRPRLAAPPNPSQL